MALFQQEKKKKIHIKRSIKRGKKTKNINLQDVECWLESGIADRSYFSNFVVQQLEIRFTALARRWIIPKSAALSIVSERAEI